MASQLLACGQGDDGGGIEVGPRAGGVQRQRFVGVTHMRRLGIVLRIHRDAQRAQVPHRAHQAQGDLAAIGDQNLPEHQAASLQDFVRTNIYRPQEQSAKVRGPEGHKGDGFEVAYTRLARAGTCWQTSSQLSSGFAVLIR